MDRARARLRRDQQFRDTPYSYPTEAAFITGAFGGYSDAGAQPSASATLYSGTAPYLRFTTVVAP